MKQRERKGQKKWMNRMAAYLIAPRNNAIASFRQTWWYGRAIFWFGCEPLDSIIAGLMVIVSAIDMIVIDAVAICRYIITTDMIVIIVEIVIQMI